MSKQPLAVRETFRNRYVLLGVVFTLILALLSATLFDMQFRLSAAYSDQAYNSNIQTLRLTGPRGKIVDRNGVPLAYNKVSYNVTFTRDPHNTSATWRQNYTRILLDTLRIIERNGGKSISTFALRHQQDGSVAFYWGENISEEAAAKREKNWRSHMTNRSVDKNAPPDQLYAQLREYYAIPEDVSVEDAFKVLSVWQEVQYTSYTSYNPIQIATNVDMTTVAEIEMRANTLTGMAIEQSDVRVYPKRDTAAHVIGYMGRMLDEQTIVEREALGYKRSDLIGISGIEATMEYELSGNLSTRTGSRVVEVDSLGKIVRDLEEDTLSPKAGNNVVLTLDSRLQKCLENALAKNILEIQAAQQAAYQENKAEYDKQVADRGGRQIQMAKMGAAVVLDVQSGEVLALANFPSYDLNMFTGGLSTAEYATLSGDERRPLFNKAIASRATPGSVFKMITGLAGLMEGVVTPTEKIDDQSPFDKYVKNKNEKAPACWISPYKLDEHAQQDMVSALKNSCNYYFYTIADRLGIDRLGKWASLFGVDSLTGIELTGEIAGQMASQQSMYNPERAPSGTALLIYNSIRDLLKSTCAELNLDYSDEKYNEVTQELMALVQLESTIGPDIRAILKNELKIPAQTISTKALDGTISAWLTEIIWDPNDTIVAGIGQSVTALTPIGIARYVSALLNGGYVYQATLLKAIITPEGEERTEPPVLVRDLGIPPEYLADIKEGMREVVSAEEGGTAGSAFVGYEYLSEIGGKTGTAQVSTIDLENNSWFVGFAPFDKPEIVIVVYVPNGYQAKLSTSTAKEIVTYYMQSKQNTAQQDVLAPANTLVP